MVMIELNQALILLFNLCAQGVHVSLEAMLADLASQARQSYHLLAMVHMLALQTPSALQDSALLLFSIVFQAIGLTPNGQSGRRL